MFKDSKKKKNKGKKKQRKKEEKETGNWEPIKLAFVCYDKIWLNRASTKINEMGGAAWEEDWGISSKLISFGRI